MEVEYVGSVAEARLLLAIGVQRRDRGVLAGAEELLRRPLPELLLARRASVSVVSPPDGIVPYEVDFLAIPQPQRLYVVLDGCELLAAVGNCDVESVGEAKQTGKGEVVPVDLNGSGLSGCCGARTMRSCSEMTSRQCSRQAEVW